MRIFFILFIFASPGMVMNWMHPSRHESIHVKLTHTDVDLQNCLDTGSEAIYRYEYKFCKRKKMWLDDCGKEIIIRKSIEYEPISESYQLSTDKLRDSDPPSLTMSLSKEEAFEETLEDTLSLKSMARELRTQKDPYYIKARVRYTCKTDVDPVLDRISRFITLGLVGLGSATSDWVDFSITK